MVFLVAGLVMMAVLHTGANLLNFAIPERHRVLRDRTGPAGWLQDSAPWLALTAPLVYIACFAIGLRPVFWLMISEIFPLRLRSKVMSVTTVANWGANFPIAGTFLLWS